MASVQFPSLQWFKELNRLVTEGDVFRKRGSGQADTRMGVKVGDEVYVVAFEAFEVSEPRQIDESALPELDFYLEQTPEEWKAMLVNIKEHGRAEGMFTLNSLDAIADDGFAKSNADYRDGDARDAFYRFNQTLQDYFDTSSELETVF